MKEFFKTLKPTTIFCILIVTIIMAAISNFTFLYIVCIIMFYIWLIRSMLNTINKSKKGRYFWMFFMPIISVIPALYFWGLMFEFRGSDISIGFLVTLGISMVITPLIVIMLFDEKGLFQFKIVLGIYLALVTTLSATMFLFMPLIVEKSTEVVFDNSFPVEELTTLLKSTDEEDQKETSELFKNLGIYNDIVDDKGQFLSKEKVIKESKGLLRENVEKVIKIIIEVILLPFLLISVWGSLIIVYRERKPIK